MTPPSGIHGFENSIDFFNKGLAAADRYNLPVINWPIFQLWKNRWMALKQDWIK
jgi:hypothetical protein